MDCAMGGEEVSDLVGGGLKGQVADINRFYHERCSPSNRYSPGPEAGILDSGPRPKRSSVDRGLGQRPPVFNNFGFKKQWGFQNQETGPCGPQGGRNCFRETMSEAEKKTKQKPSACQMSKKDHVAEVNLRDNQKNTKL